MLVFQMRYQMRYVDKTSTVLKHSYASWERGLNENTNGLVRQYCPKGSSFEHVDDDYTEMIMERLNNRPRKTLGMKTPVEALLEKLKGVAVMS